MWSLCLHGAGGEMTGTKHTHKHKPIIWFNLGASGAGLPFYSEVATGSAALAMRLVTDC